MHLLKFHGRIRYQIKKGHHKGVEVKDMRIEVLARKENETATVYRKFYNEVSATIFEWEMRMKGYKTRVVVNG